MALATSSHRSDTIETGRPYPVLSAQTRSQRIFVIMVHPTRLPSPLHHSGDAERTEHASGFGPSATSATRETRCRVLTLVHRVRSTDDRTIEKRCHWLPHTQERDDIDRITSRSRQWVDLPAALSPLGEAAPLSAGRPRNSVTHGLPHELSMSV